MVDTEADVARVVDVAKGLEGLRRQDGIHAAAVVITKDPLTDYLPIQRKPVPGKPIEEAPVVTQYEMHGVEALGLLKMDFLGLRNLDVITDTLELIKKVRGETVDIDSVSLDDPATFEMLRQGNSIGVFQLESAPMRSLIRQMAPTGFDDIAALVALYRPGPMAQNMHTSYADRKNGREPNVPFHPDAAEILGDTYNLCIYQEELMQLAQKFAGYDLAQADNLRKAMGKKDRELIGAERKVFVEGCAAVGYGAELGEELFDTMEPFADYAFNKSHSYGYGLVSYQTAYLKANYPEEYLASLLTSVKGSLDKAAVYLNECRQMGINVLVPDVNVSERDFTSIPDPEGGDLNAIAFGMSTVRNVGEALVDLIVAERVSNGPFEDFVDFCGRVDYQVLNKRTIESLIKAGAFDSLGHPRKGLLLVYEEILDKTLATRKEADMGVMTLFGAAETSEGGFDDRPEIPPQMFDKTQRLAFEKEMLGLYVSDHPLMGIEGAVKRRAEHSLSQMEDMEDGKFITVGGVITGLQKKWTRGGDLMAVFVLEDLTHSAEVMVFPKTFADYGHLLDDDRVVIVRGRNSTRDETPKVMAQGIEIFDTEALSANRPLRLIVRPEQLSDDMLGRLKNLLTEHQGQAPVTIDLGAEKLLRLPEEFNVETNDGLIPELRVLLGEGGVRLGEA